jgi:hypothetical protein
MAIRTNFLFHGAKALVDQVILIAEDSWSHPVRYTTLSESPLYERSADTDTSTCQHKTLTRQIFMPSEAFEPQSKQASGRRPAP